MYVHIGKYTFAATIKKNVWVIIVNEIKSIMSVQTF